MPPYDEYSYNSSALFSGIKMIRKLVIGDSIVESKMLVEIPIISLEELEKGIPHDIINLVQPLVDNGFRPEGFVQ